MNEMITKFVVVAGMPLSGKSTLLRNLSAYCRLQVMQEVGGLCRATTDIPFYHQVDGIDEMIMAEEFAADRERWSRSAGILGLEQWHIGNIAFASLRLSPVVEDYCNRFAKTLAAHRPSAVFSLHLPVQEYVDRKYATGGVATHDELSFVEDWNRTIQSVLSRFDVGYIELNGACSPDDVLHSAKPYIDALQNDACL